MNKLIIIFIIISIVSSKLVYSQKIKTDGNVFGHVVSNGQHIPYCSIAVKGTVIGVVSDETGHYQLINLPLGTHTLVVNCIGYKTGEQTITIEANKTLEVNFALEKDILQISEVIVSSSRSAQKRLEAPVIVNTISPNLFASTQSLTFGEVLNFTPGLRLENNCQNCGFTQVRINGMEGAYSQILINSKPIFSGLAAVYGLELVPANMIERIEVVRGGGSAIYGSNAIAGTVNLILKNPAVNTYEVGINTNFTGVGMNQSNSPAMDYSTHFNTSLVSENGKAGITVYGFSRERKMFDANGDGFSEIAPLNNLTIGSSFTYRINNHSKLGIDFFNIKEERNGGNRQEYPVHERDIAEVVKHDIKTAALNYEHIFREYDLFSTFASAQYLNRDSYYGANRSLKSYGKSYDFTYNTGVQYKAVFHNASLVAGFENTGGFLTDKKLGYPDYDNAVIVNDSITEVPHTMNNIIAEQSSITTGIFVQFERTINKIKLELGGRYENYNLKNLAKDNYKKSGNIISPRISLMYNISEYLQVRTSYSQGYRAPQIYNEDLHIETSGSRQVIHENDPELKHENSYSIMASLDLNKRIGTVYTGLLVEAFHTRLKNPFLNEFGLPDENGIVVYTRKNAKTGATVYGFNFEANLKLIENFGFSSGFTIQTSKYDSVQQFNEKHFFRTPDHYGFFTVDWDCAKSFRLSVTGNYTGKMLVPYFGTETDPDQGEIRESGLFFDAGLKLRYNMKLNGSTFQWFAGIKNIFNSYQKDYDSGVNRDPGYTYGPILPRTVYFGIKIGDMLN
ncbi:MAG: TonB-dependent receptor [Bacteroidales bacterium]|nr:TonB-dependent receptor [Bacteroidales bacterium]